MKNKKTVFLIVIVISIVGGLIVWFGASMLAPGIDPDSERYELNYSEEKVRASINEFKEKNPDYFVPKITINNQGPFELPDARSDDPVYYYYYYYYKDEKQILFTWIRSAGRNKTIFAFVSVNEGLNLPNWKDINTDFSWSENKEQKKKFEERILKKIEKILSEPK
jgi:hypothetical protein